MALGVATSAVLVWFHWLVRPEVTHLAAKLPMIFLQNLVVAALCFSALNALLEELVFRGVLYEALAAEWGGAVAVGGTAAAFGLGHLAGYPPGITGAILAGLYGIALGLLRWWAGGLGLVLACHMAADATIFGLMAWEGAFRGAEG
jgi:membrane protease YdiL (CAAX protease family)